MSKGFFDKLRKIFKGAKLYSIVKEEISEVLMLFDNFERIYKFSKVKYNSAIGIYEFSKLIKDNYDLFFSLPDSFSSALLGFFSGARERIGYSGQLRDFLLTRVYKKPKNLHRVEEYCFLLKDFDSEVLSNIKVNLDIEPSRELLNINARYKIAVNINSEAQSRRMSISKWARIIERILKETDSYIILTGSKKDINRVNWLIETLEDNKRILNFTGKTNLITLSSIIKSCNLMLSADSGPAHLANALGIKTVVLFGAGDERNTAPYNKEILRIVRINLDCSPCLKNTCKYKVPICLENIEEETIVNAVFKFLEKD